MATEEVRHRKRYGSRHGRGTKQIYATAVDPIKKHTQKAHVKRRLIIDLSGRCLQGYAAAVCAGAGRGAGSPSRSSYESAVALWQ